MADAELVRQASSDTDTERSDAEEWALVNNSAEIVENSSCQTNSILAESQISSVSGSSCDEQADPTRDNEVNSLRETSHVQDESGALPPVRKDSQSGSSTSSEFVRVPFEGGDDIVINTGAEISISSRCCECENRHLNASDDFSDQDEDDVIIADDVETAEEDVSLMDDANSIIHETTLDASTIVAEDERASFTATPSLFNEDLPQNFVQHCSNRIRNYIHSYNPHLNWRLTLIVALSCTAVIGLGVGHFMGHSTRRWNPFGLRRTSPNAANLQEMWNQKLRDYVEYCQSSKDTMKNAHDEEIQNCRQKTVTNAAAQQQQGQYCTREDGEAVRLRRHVNALARHMRNDRRKLKLAKFDRLRMVSLAAQLNEKLSRANAEISKLEEQNVRLQSTEEELKVLKQQRDFWTIHLDNMTSKLSSYLKRLENVTLFSDEFYWKDFPEQFQNLQKNFQEKVKEAKKIYGAKAEKFGNSIADRLQKFWTETSGTGEKLKNKFGEHFGKWKQNVFETFDEILANNRKSQENVEKSEEEENFQDENVSEFQEEEFVEEENEYLDEEEYFIEEETNEEDIVSVNEGKLQQMRAAVAALRQALKEDRGFKIWFVGNFPEDDELGTAYMKHMKRLERATHFTHTDDSFWQCQRNWWLGERIARNCGEKLWHWQRQVDPTELEEFVASQPAVQEWRQKENEKLSNWILQRSKLRSERREAEQKADWLWFRSREREEQRKKETENWLQERLKSGPKAREQQNPRGSHSDSRGAQSDTRGFQSDPRGAQRDQRGAQSDSRDAQKDQKGSCQQQKQNNFQRRQRRKPNYCRFG